MVPFFIDLEKAHDNSKDRAEWLLKMKAVALKWELKKTKLDHLYRERWFVSKKW